MAEIEQEEEDELLTLNDYREEDEKAPPPSDEQAEGDSKEADDGAQTERAGTFFTEVEVGKRAGQAVGEVQRGVGEEGMGEKGELQNGDGGNDNKKCEQLQVVAEHTGETESPQQKLTLDPGKCLDGILENFC